MLKKHLLLTCALLTLSLGAEAAIDKVIVYAGGQAKVIRHYPLNQIKQVDGHYRLDDVPAGAIADSIRLSATDAQLSDTRIDKAFDKSDNDKAQALREQLDKLQQQQQRLEAERSYTTTVKKLVLAAAQQGKEAELPSPARIRELAKLRQQAALKQLNYEQQIKDVKESISRVKKELSQYSKESKQHYRVDFDLAGKPPSSTVVKLSYRIHHVAWKPSYALHVDTASKTLTLKRYLSVRQISGEDWDNITLVLSNERPSHRRPPEHLSSWRIGLTPKHPRRRAFEAMSLSAAPQLKARRAAAEPRADISTQSSEFALRYVIESASVPSRNGWSKLALGSISEPVELHTLVRPQRQLTWLWLDTKLSEVERLPAGPVKRYRDGAFLGESRLSLWTRGESRQIPLGPDRLIEVDYRLLDNQSGEDGLLGLGGDSLLQRRYQLSISNHHSRAWPVIAEYRIPVASNQEISVEPNDQLSEHWKKVAKRPGIYRLSLPKLAPDATYEAQLGFDISWPQERSLSGINVPNR